MKPDVPKNRTPVEISGPIRAERVGGNWYVVGGEVLIPVKNELEADALVAKLRDQGFSE